MNKFIIVNPFKFFQKPERVFSDWMDQMDDYHLGGITIQYEEYEGWSAHHNNLPPGQCPYDIGTREREHWMTGWSNRENAEYLKRIWEREDRTNGGDVFFNQSDIIVTFSGSTVYNG